LTFDLEIQTRPSEDQTRLSCEFGVDPFSGSRDISYTNKKTQTDGANNRTHPSSVREVKSAKFTVWDKVAEGITLMFEDTRITY